MNYQQEIASITEGGEWVWPESDYGCAEIRKVNGRYEVWGIPMYGGRPYYSETVDTPDEVVKLVESWT